MDQITLVDHQNADGEKLITELKHHSIDVREACWIKTTEDGQWYLYIVSPIVDSYGRKETYRRVHSVMRTMKQPLWIDPLEVRLVATSETLAQDLERIRNRFVVKMPTRCNGSHIGDMDIEGAYIYSV
jgi:hypothetical protein